MSKLHWPIGAALQKTASWIAFPDSDTRSNIVFRARQSWNLREVPESCLLHIAAESRYRLYINGRRAGLGPIRGTCGSNYFDSYQIANLLQPGENWVAVEVQSPNIPTFKTAPALPAVLLQIEDGAAVATDESWQVQLAPDWRQDVPLFTFQIGYMEWQDRREYPNGWQIGKDDAASWRPAVVVQNDPRIAGKSLVPRDIPALREQSYWPVSAPMSAQVPPLEDPADTQVAKRMNSESHAPLIHAVTWTSLLQASGGAAVLQPLADGGGVVVAFDFGREINGAIEIDVTGPAGAIVDIGYGEELANNRLPVVLGAYLFADRYILTSGRQTVGNHFAERGLRIVQIVFRNFSQPLHLHGIRGIDRTYPYVSRGSFVSSDTRLDAVWTTCANTINACATDTFVDCPWRENAFYTNDMWVENLTSLQAFGDPYLNAHCLRLMTTQTQADGLITSSVPTGIIPGKTAEESRDYLTFPAANLALAMILEEYLLYCGDTELVRTVMPRLTGIYGAVQAWEDSKGLLLPPKKYWNFVDWSFELTHGNAVMDNKNTAVLNWIYVHSLDATARLMNYLDQPGQVAHLHQKAKATAEAIDRRFWNDDRQCYIEWWSEGKQTAVANQITQALALLSGRAPESRIKPLAAALTRTDLIVPELYMQHMVLRALMQTSQGPAALDLIRKLWGSIIEAGSPTIWENNVHGHGKSAWNGAGSNCHGFSTAPISFFQQVILGVRPTAPGFRQCVIDPHPLGLTHALGRVPTPHGNIELAWRHLKTEGANGELRVDIKIPAGVTASLVDGRPLSSVSHTLNMPRQQTPEL